MTQEKMRWQELPNEELEKIDQKYRNMTKEQKILWSKKCAKLSHLVKHGASLVQLSVIAELDFTKEELALATAVFILDSTNKRENNKQLKDDVAFI